SPGQSERETDQQALKPEGEDVNTTFFLFLRPMAGPRRGGSAIFVPGSSRLAPSRPSRQQMFDFSVSGVLALPWESKDHLISGVFLPRVTMLRARSPRASTTPTLCRPSPSFSCPSTCVPSSGETVLGQSAPEARGRCRRRLPRPFRPTEHRGPRHSRPLARNCGPRSGAVLLR